MKIGKILFIAILILGLFLTYAYFWEENVLSWQGQTIKRDGTSIFSRTYAIDGGTWFIPDIVQKHLNFKISMPSPFSDEKSRYIRVNNIKGKIFITAGKVSS